MLAPRYVHVHMMKRFLILLTVVPGSIVGTPPLYFLPVLKKYLDYNYLISPPSAPACEIVRGRKRRRRRKRQLLSDLKIPPPPSIHREEYQNSFVREKKGGPPRTGEEEGGK